MLQLVILDIFDCCHLVTVLQANTLIYNLIYIQVPINILVRLRSLENQRPITKRKFNKAILFDWIKKVQFKLAQVEVQSSTAVTFLAI